MQHQGAKGNQKIKRERMAEIRGLEKAHVEDFPGHHKARDIIGMGVGGEEEKPAPLGIVIQD